MSTTKKNYYQLNPEKYKAQASRYYNEHKEELNVKRRAYLETPMTCDRCGMTVQRGGIYRHKASKKCQNYVAPAPVSDE